MRIAVTGATGFLGRYIVRHLAATGHRLCCWYRPGSDYTGFDEVAAAIEWLPGELGDESAVRQLVQGADAVVHAAIQWEGPRTRGSGHHGAASVFSGINRTVVAACACLLFNPLWAKRVDSSSHRGGARCQVYRTPRNTTRPARALLES